MNRDANSSAKDTTEPNGSVIDPATVVAYEPPTLTPLGNLRDLLGKSGRRRDMAGPHPRRR
jgi:hypothetical protein